MRYSVMVHDAGDRVRHVDATSAEDALRQVVSSSGGGPFRARFLTVDEAQEHEPSRVAEFLATRRRTGSQDSGHTRTSLGRDVLQ